MSAEYEESNAIWPKVMRTVNLKATWTQKIGLTGMVAWIIQMTAKMTGRRRMKPSFS